MTNPAAGAVSLKVLAERKIDGVGKATIFNVDPRLIKIQPGFNARPIDPEHVASIKLAYKSGTVLPPLYVRVADGSIIVVGGHHRLTAMMELIAEGHDVKSTPCIEFKGTDAERIVHMLTSAKNKELTPLQQGVQYRLLINMGWSAQQIADTNGMSITHVNQTIELASSNTDVQAMVTRGEVAADVALKVVKQHGDNAGPVLAAALVTAKAAGKTKVTKKTLAPTPFDALLKPHVPVIVRAEPKVTGITDDDRLHWLRVVATQQQVISWAVAEGRKDAFIDKHLKVK